MMMAQMLPSSAYSHGVHHPYSTPVHATFITSTCYNSTLALNNSHLCV